MWPGYEARAATEGRTHLDQEEGDAIRPEGAAELNVAELGVDLTKVVQLAVLCEDEFLQALKLGVLARQELLQSDGARFVLCLIMIAILHLALQGRKLDGFLTGAGMSAVNDGVT